MVQTPLVRHAAELVRRPDPHVGDPRMLDLMTAALPLSGRIVQLRADRPHMGLPPVRQHPVKPLSAVRAAQDLDIIIQKQQVRPGRLPRARIAHRRKIERALPIQIVDGKTALFRFQRFDHT